MTRLFLTIALVFAALPAFAQQLPKPDDRYRGYPASLVKFPTALPDLPACQAGEYYEPSDFDIAKYAVRVKMAEKFRVQDYDECVWMLTSQGYRYVMRPKGTIVAVDLQGRDLFDFGSPGGKPCKNPRPFSIAFKPARPIGQIVQEQPRVERPAAKPAPLVQLHKVEPGPATPTPAPTPRYEPPPSRVEAEEEEVEQDGKLSVTAGVEYVFGRMKSEYTDPIPDRGDVPQRHGFTALVPFVRFDLGDDEGKHGLFAYLATSALGAASKMEFQNLRGEWHEKIRTTDDSLDKLTTFRAGYKFGWGEGLTVGPYVGWAKRCLPCERYTAQGANTITERTFKGLVLGGELTGRAGDRVTVNVLGEIGPSLTRESWTKQTFGTINFPQVNHPDEKAKTFNFRIGAEAKIAGPLHATGAYDYLWISSRRPENYAAAEKTGVNAFSIGLVGKFSW